MQVYTLPSGWWSITCSIPGQQKIGEELAKLQKLCSISREKWWEISPHLSVMWIVCHQLFHSSCASPGSYLGAILKHSLKHPPLYFLICFNSTSFSCQYSQASENLSSPRSKAMGHFPLHLAVFPLHGNKKQNDFGGSQAFTKAAKSHVCVIRSFLVPRSL